MVKVTVYYKGKKYGQEQVNVDSAKDAILKIVCDVNYPAVYRAGKRITKVSFKKFDEVRSRDGIRFAIHTVKKYLDNNTLEIVSKDEYWLI